MRLTVGPLPSAVYWRRRAIVLGAMFIVLLVLFTTCRGGGGSGASPTGATSSPTVDATESSPDATESPTLTPTQAPTTAPALPPPATSAPPDQGPSKGDCTDAEIKVTPAPSLTDAPAGQTIIIKLRIKNVSDRECTRDVGPDEQEIYIKKGAETIWSSDRCSTFRGSERKPFPEDLEMEFQVTWNGRQSTNCKSGAATGVAPSPGSYEVFGRLGSNLSAPVKLTLT